MMCDECGCEMLSQRATAEAPYKYDRSGLPILLVGIEILSCDRCGVRLPLIPKLTELHQVIADAIVAKPGKLSGPEVRFLRKHIGLSGQRFALLLGVSGAHLSRVENGHTKHFGVGTDRIARFAAAKANATESNRDALIRLAEILHATRKARRSLLKKGQTIALRGGTWCVADAA